MLRYRFEAADADGALVRGIESANDERALDRRLRQDGMMLVKAVRLRESRRKSSSTRDLVDMCYHLAVVVEAGIPILEGLRDLSNSEHSLNETIRDVTRKVESGESLSTALEDHPEHFPDLLCRLVRAGEESGALDRVLKDLVAYLEWREDLRRRISSAATYPIMVLVGLGGLGVLLTMWVLPSFLEIFAELGASLPATTRGLIWVHDFIAAYWMAMLIGGALLAFGTAAALRNEAVRFRFHGLLLAIPVLGSVILMIEMSRFAHNLGLMLSTGIPMIRSLHTVEEVVQNRVLRQTLRRSRERVERGATLTDALGHSAAMPALALRMISVGESSGNLEESLQRVADYYDKEIPIVVDRSLAFFNTAAMILLGAALVTVALSIFGPLYQMMGELNG